MIDQFLTSCDDVAPARLRRSPVPASAETVSPRPDAHSHRAFAAGVVLVASVLGTTSAPGTETASATSEATEQAL